MRWFTSALVLVLPTALAAQNVFHGNGIPSAYVENTPGVLGQQLTVGYGSPTTPLPLAIFALSDGIGPVFIPHPLLGNIGLDVFSPAYQSFSFSLDATGHGSSTLLLPPGYPLSHDPPLFAHAATFEATGLSISKTVRIEWANPDGWEGVATLTSPRFLHTATPLGAGPRDNVTEVLIGGGSTGTFVAPVPMSSAVLYKPLTRSLTTLPSMSLARSMHCAVRLADGRALITGGVTSSGATTATCEFFDLATSTFSNAPPMRQTRAGHAMTLLGDGRVLVTGGVFSWQNVNAASFINSLNSARNSAEVFDPASNTWSPLPSMASNRFGHSQTRLLDGRVLVACGIFGGYVGAFPFGSGSTPRYTGSCEIFDPVTNTFTATGSLTTTILLPNLSMATLTGRAFHGASLRADGNVQLTGGLVADAPFGSQSDDTISIHHGHLWQVATGTWTPAGFLFSAVAFHGQHALGNGTITCGGFAVDAQGLSWTMTATAQTLFTPVSGANTTLRSIGLDVSGGTAQPRGMHTFTPLYDGTFLVYGGGSPGPVGSGWVYTPD